MSKIIVVVEVFGPQRQGVDALGHQFIDGVHDPIGIATIRDTRRELTDDPGNPLRLSRQQAPAIRRNVPAVESSYNIPSSEG